LGLLGSVYLGKDIFTGADVALKFGLRLSLSYKHQVYTTIASSKGIPQVLWYGREDVHDVIVLDYLGTSLDDLINQLKFDHRETFSYASQMVRLFCYIK
jgi:casein kinase 1